MPIVPMFTVLSQAIKGIIVYMYYYEVAPTKIIRANAHTFTYKADNAIPLGSFVMVSVGKQSLTGVVVKRVTKPSYNTKAIDELLDIPTLTQPLLETALWMSSYYHTHFATVLQTILPRGITKRRRANRKSPLIQHRERTNYLLNSLQQKALGTLINATPGTAILHGITGSGKTAVYIEYARTIITSGKSVVVLVPEIALTSQLVAEFRHHFDNIILAHSKQTEAERHLSWIDAATSQEPTVVIGPRSALFLPLPSIGAIIVDESHEPSYKQDQSPRYSALRVAGVLASHYRCLIIQGSATPLVSEYFLAKNRKRPIITMSQRARGDAVEPEITVVDMTKRTNFVQHKFLSDKLLSSISASLENNHQVLIFHNRRGSASTTLCEKCGWSATCQRCYIPLTLHADNHTMRCHICGGAERVPTVCPTCASTDIIHKGIGTKLIEAELRKKFPKATMMRFDGDSEDTETVEKQYQALYNGDIQIIIGTQVVAKGLDLPHLRTVGVVQADAGLSMPDFTASERTFQLISQVVGRVGRSHHNTEVIIQSYQPNNPVVQYGINQDYANFYTETLDQRRRGNFPPFTYLLRFTCTYKTEAAAIRNSKSLSATIRKQFPDVVVLGPTPAFYERQRDTYRWQIVVKSPKRSRLLEVIDHIPPAHWQYDIDPMSLLS